LGTADPSDHFWNRKKSRNKSTGALRNNTKTTKKKEGTIKTTYSLLEVQEEKVTRIKVTEETSWQNRNSKFFFLKNWGFLFTWNRKSVYVVQTRKQS
jgi:hypothetical protein